MRKCQKLPLCSTELIPASCRMDPTLTKPKPISDDGGTSEIKFLRRRGRGQRERFERNSPADPKVSEEGEEGKCSRSQNRDFPCTLWKTPMLKQFMNNCSLWEGPTLDKFVKDCVPWEEPLARAAKEREEGVAETT